MTDHDPRMTGTKRCSRCGVSRPVLAFAANRKSADGLASWCRECDRARSHGEKRSRMVLEGWDEVVGIEREAEYVEIAEARLRHWSGVGPSPLEPESSSPARTDLRPGAQPSLFDAWQPSEPEEKA